MATALLMDASPTTKRKSAAAQILTKHNNLLADIKDRQKPFNEADWLTINEIHATETYTSGINKLAGWLDLTKVTGKQIDANIMEQLNLLINGQAFKLNMLSTSENSPFSKTNGNYGSHLAAKMQMFLVEVKNLELSASKEKGR